MNRSNHRGASTGYKKRPIRRTWKEGKQDEDKNWSDIDERMDRPIGERNRRMDRLANTQINEELDGGCGQMDELESD